MSTGVVNVAIDLGGSGARVSLSDEAGRRVFEGPGWDPATGALGHLALLIERVSRSEHGKRLAVSAGLTGLNGMIPSLENVGQSVHHQFGVDRLVVADDSLTSALGATGGRPGVVLAVGTGAVALGLGPGGEVARVDGGGGYLGDRGSAWWIGRQGLIAAISSLEGRAGASPVLSALATRRFGQLSTLPQRLRESSAPFRDIAQFSTDVAQAARAGDSESAAIFRHAGVHLAAAAAAAAERSKLGAAVNVSVLGGVSKASDLFLPALLESFSSQGFDGTLREPLGDSLKGAESLLVAGPPLMTDLLATWES